MRGYWINKGGSSPTLFSETIGLPPILLGDYITTSRDNYLNSAVTIPSGSASELVYEEGQYSWSKSKVFVKDIVTNKNIPSDYYGEVNEFEYTPAGEIKFTFDVNPKEKITSARCWDVGVKVIQITPNKKGVEIDKYSKKSEYLPILKQNLEEYSRLYNAAKQATNNFGISPFTGTCGKHWVTGGGSVPITMKQNKKYVGSGGAGGGISFNNNGDMLQRIYFNDTAFSFTGDTGVTSCSLLRNNWTHDNNETVFDDIKLNQYKQHVGIPFYYSNLTRGRGQRASNGAVDMYLFNQFFKNEFSGSNYTDVYEKQYGINQKSTLYYMSLSPYVTACDNPWLGDGSGILDSAIQDPYTYEGVDYYKSDPARYMYITTSQGSSNRMIRLNSAYIVLTYIKNDIITVTHDNSKPSLFLYSAIQERR